LLLKFHNLTIPPFLPRLQKDGLIGYCLSGNTFTALAEENDRTEKAKADFSKSVEDTIAHMKWTLELIWLHRGFENFYTRPGSKLISKSKLQDYHESKKGYGSIGVFGETEKHETVFTTAGHIFPGVKEEAFYLPDNPLAASNTTNLSTEEIKIGTCISNLLYKEKTGLDFAIVKVDEDKTEMCQRNVGNELPTSIALCDTSSIEVGELVHKVGAVTGYTTGIVKSNDFHQLNDDIDNHGTFVLIENSDDEKPFADSGDSGAVVFRKNFDGQPTVEVISTVLGGTADDKNDKMFFVLTLRMDKALQQTEKEENIKVNIKH